MNKLLLIVLASLSLTVSSTAFAAPICSGTYTTPGQWNYPDTKAFEHSADDPTSYQNDDGSYGLMTPLTWPLVHILVGVTGIGETGVNAGGAGVCVAEKAVSDLEIGKTTKKMADTTAKMTATTNQLAVESANK